MKFLLSLVMSLVLVVPVLAQEAPPPDVTAQCIPQEAAATNLKQAGMRPIFGVFDGKQLIFIFVNPEQQTYVITMMPASNTKVMCLLSQGSGYQLHLENLSDTPSVPL